MFLPLLLLWIFPQSQLSMSALSFLPSIPAGSTSSPFSTLSRRRDHTLAILHPLLPPRPRLGLLLLLPPLLTMPSPSSSSPTVATRPSQSSALSYCPDYALTLLLPLSLLQPRPRPRPPLPSPTGPNQTMPFPSSSISHHPDPNHALLHLMRFYRSLTPTSQTSPPSSNSSLVTLLTSPTPPSSTSSSTSSPLSPSILMPNSSLPVNFGVEFV